MAKHHRKGYVRKDGVRVKPTWVRGRNPKAGCSIWLLGVLAVVAIAWILS